MRNCYVYELCTISIKFGIYNFLLYSTVNKAASVRAQRPHRESEGITQIIKIHTDKHRSILAEIDDAIQTVLETGELPLFENGGSLNVLI